MVKETSEPGGAKPQLSRELVLDRAMELADEAGLESLTMRSLAVALGVKPMSVYYYVAKKSEILDGLVDRVFAEADSARSRQDDSWQRAMRERAMTMRSVLGRHRWALGLIESRTSPGSATLRHHNETLGILRQRRFFRRTGSPRLRPARQLHLWFRVAGIDDSRRRRNDRKRRRSIHGQAI